MISSIAIYCLHIVKWFQVLLFIICIQLNGFKYCYLLFAHSQMVSSIVIYYLRTVKWFQVLLFIICMQSNDFKYCYLLFAHIVM